MRSEAARDAGPSAFHPTQTPGKQPGRSLAVRHHGAGPWEQAFYLFRWGLLSKSLRPGHCARNYTP
ncbi:hypothetical protein CFR78_15190 [Komagataeibacter rhaeticus]|nr:hypothetical protein GLUCORHAEAF1_12160 [Komagataeibacter rhaeticus AF1]PYD52366.1 hypothetical protein CFR78_15190 [Komagataeibacter rhaeticus]